MGAALNVAAGALATVTVVDAAADPPAPLQLRVNVLLPAVASAFERLPAVPSVPVQAPLATHADALVVDHINVTLAPAVSVAEDEVKVTVGAAAGVTAVGGVVEVEVVEVGVEATPLTSVPPHALRQKAPNEARAMAFIVDI